jgi:hypothetical protein
MRESLDRILEAAPRVLAADDRVFEAVHRGARQAAVDESLRPRIVGLLAAWHSKASAAHPGSDLALRVRFHWCTERLYANLARETLGTCAEDLHAAWEQRIADGRPFDAFSDEAQLALAIARMHVAHAWAANDFAGGAAGARRVRERAATRLARPQYDDVHHALQQMENELAAKARESR